MDKLDTFSKLACLDLETTGARPTRDRITEIGVVLVDGDQVLEEWSTLVNPEARIPYNIQQLTGITDEMVEDAPLFANVADILIEKLSGRVLVAHNARFDVGFLRNECRRVGLEFSQPVVCTVKLSRTLYPQHRRHNLDSLMHRHHLTCEARHRALGDARVLPALINSMVRDYGHEAVHQAMAAQQQIISLPPYLPADLPGILPERPGVYLFYGENDSLLYVGKSVNLRNRILSHFSGDHRHDREMRIAQQIRHVDWQETAGEFGALMREAELVKSRSPLLNRRLRRQQELYSILWPQQGIPEIVSVNELDSKQLQQVYGLFRSKRQANNRLRKLADEHHLCQKQLGLEKGKGACFAYQLHKCHGVCCGKESLIKHTHRLLNALMPLKLQAWPWRGAIGIQEHQADTGQTDIHIIAHWCYLGTVHGEHELDDFIPPEALQLDKDFYRLCLRQLNKQPTVIDLSDRIVL